MKKTSYRMVLWVVLLISGFLLSCNEKDPDQLVIKMFYPKSIVMKDDFSNTDTFRFDIVSNEAVIERIRLYENDSLFVDLAEENFGADKRDYQLYVLYNPKSPGNKNFEIIVDAPPYTKSSLFSVSVSD